MDRRTIVTGLGALGLLSGCGSKFRRYEGPDVTRVLVFKEKRSMYLMADQNVLKAYHVDLGFAPEGHKQIEGDGRTPEGHYLIDRRNPNSDFHLSIGISYPNSRDIARARAMGRSPGGDIFIHGDPKLMRRLKGPDWTYGCIAVSNEEMEEVYAMVATGTPISIYP